MSFLSQYPGEDEVLMPPLSFLEIKGKPSVEDTVKGQVMVHQGKSGVCVSACLCVGVVAFALRDALPHVSCACRM